MSDSKLGCLISILVPRVTSGQPIGMQPSQALTVNPYSILESITPAARYSIRLCNAKTDAALGGFPRQLAEIHSRLRQCRFIDRLRQRPVAQDGLDLE